MTKLIVWNFIVLLDRVSCLEEKQLESSYNTCQDSFFFHVHRVTHAEDK
ncbi:MAG: hypothetical protein ACXAEU_18660 [Candidatus Hodarchaeales archaeon]